MGIKILIKMLEFMPESVTKKIASRYVRGILHKYANVSVEGYENIKDLKGPILFICNHLSNSLLCHLFLLFCLMSAEHRMFIFNIIFRKKLFYR